MEIIVSDAPEERTYSELPPEPPKDASKKTLAAYEKQRRSAMVIRYEVRPADDIAIANAFMRAGVDASQTKGVHENRAVTSALAAKCVTKIAEATFRGEPLILVRKRDGKRFEPGAPEYVPLALMLNRGFAHEAGNEAYLMAMELDRQRGNSEPASE